MRKAQGVDREPTATQIGQDDSRQTCAASAVLNAGERRILSRLYVHSDRVLVNVSGFCHVATGSTGPASWNDKSQSTSRAIGA